MILLFVSQGLLCIFDNLKGDSGGPLIEKRGGTYFLIGIVSYGVPCGVKDYPTIYTKVSRYMTWINSKVKL